MENMEKKTAVIEELKRKGLDCTIFTKQTNGVKRDGVMDCSDIKVHPVCYPNWDFSTVDDIVEFTINTFDSLKEDNPFFRDELDEMIENIRSWEYAKALIFPYMYKDCASSFLYEEYLDLKLAYRIRIGEMYSIPVSTALFDIWKISKEEVKETAFQNVRNIGVSIENICELVKRMDPDMAFQLEGADIPMNVVYIGRENPYNNGASILAMPEVLKTIAQSYNDDVIIIPSSICEIITVPASLSDFLPFLNEMITQVNETELEPEEVLSNHFYYYSKDEERILLEEEVKEKIA